MTKIAKSLAVAAALLSAVSANAVTLTFNGPNFSGGAQNSGSGTITTWNIVLPVGKTITAANFSSEFGDLQGDGSTALGFVTVGGITVATCASTSSQCFLGPNTPISYDFLPSEFGALLGSVDLAYVQTSPSRFGLSPSTLSITIDGVPEPQSWAMLIAGFGLIGAAMRRRATTVAA